MRQPVVARRLPRRLERSNPRVVKQKLSNFRVKTAEHQPWPQPTNPFRDAIVLLISTALPLAMVRERLGEARAVSTVDFAFHAALATATDATLAEIASLAELGVRSFKFFLTYRALGLYTDLGFLLEAMQEIARVGRGTGPRGERRSA